VVGAVVALTSSLGGTGRRQPRRRALRRGGGSVEKVSKWASFSRCQMRWRVPQLGNATGRTLGSPRRPLLAPVGGSGRDGRAAGCSQGEVEEARTRDEKASGSYRRLAPLLHRRARGSALTSQARHAAGTTPQGDPGCADFMGLGVLPASGRSNLGKMRAGPDCEAGAARARRRPARNRVIVPCFQRLKLKKIE
jgi:hypothetical protein